MRIPSLRTATISFAALALPAALLSGGLVSAYFKSVNPDNVDITQGLAYLQQSILASGITFTLLAMLSIIGIVKMYKRDKNFVEAKLPIVLLCAVFVLMVGALATNSYISKIEDQYLKDNGRPTTQQYFDALDKQKR